MDRKTVIAGLLAAVAIACGEAAGEVTSGAMIETGDMLRDAGLDMLADAATEAGEALGDGGAPEGDAAAQPVGPTVLEADCEIESGTRETREDGSYRISTKLYAELDVSAYQPEQLVGAAFVLCELEEERMNNPRPEKCGDDLPIECVGDFPLPLPDCTIETRIEVREGKALVRCGDYFEDDQGGLQIEGHRYESVKLVIP